MEQLHHLMEGQKALAVQVKENHGEMKEQHAAGIEVMVDMMSLSNPTPHTTTMVPDDASQMESLDEQIKQLKTSQNVQGLVDLCKQHMSNANAMEMICAAIRDLTENGM